MAPNRSLVGLAVVCGIAGVVWTAGAQQNAGAPPQGLSSRKTTAVTYEAGRTTKIDLVGTPLMPRTRGEAEIQTESAGPVRIKAKMRDVTPASQFGPEYLTFVLWVIPPQGRAKNLGEVRLDDGENQIEATSDVQTFALIVTAEPYYAVTTPSEVVVMENAVRQDTRGHTSIATLSYEIVPRGAYIAGGPFSLPAPNKKEPPDVQQARNAVAIAQIAQADKFVPDGLATARRLLNETELLVKRKESKREIISHARATVQAGEEARLQSVERRGEAEARAEREAIEAREKAARDAAAREAAGRATAEQERQRAERAAQEAAALKQQAEQAAQQAALEQQKAEQARSEAERARAEAQAQTARAESLRAQAEQDRATLRATLLRQFNDILDTRDTTRGLIVNVGDVLFETGRYELRPPAREKLARFAGIVLAHPGLLVQAEGFTDSTGTDEINERLSKQRANAVGEYLVSQGLASDRVTTQGFGASSPVASNDTREGRQQNRRVELVVSGEVIGTPLSDARQ
ncbi:MAG TPA: OmpA family protein [Vicinamibacterales bacterium]|jgi:outer membrane protein OmpA-like peptidoglycan-associated protein